MAKVDYTEFDRQIWSKELEGFVPGLVYDMHTHIWSEYHKGALQDPPTGLRLEVDYNSQIEWAVSLFPGREMHFLVLGTPVPGMNVEGHNAWMAREAARDPASAVCMAVRPDMSPRDIAEQVGRHGFVGLKPYRSFAPDPASARIGEFLPDAQVEVADDLGLAITLHLSKKTGIADPENLKDLRELTRRYPRVQWILAHCARAFNAFMLKDSIHVLKDIPNLWYDTAAVNDLYSHYLLMRHEDRKRVMFGSDDVVAGCARGKYITYGNAWLYFEGKEELEHCDPRSTFVIYEQLRQERQVADMLGLTGQEIQDHFSGNAIRLLDRVRGNRAVSR